MKIINKNEKSYDGWNQSTIEMELYDDIIVHTPNPNISYIMKFDKLGGIRLCKVAGDGIFAPNDTPFKSLEKYMSEEL